MIQIIPENKKPSFGEIIGQGLYGAGQTVGQMIPQHLIGKQALAKKEQEAKKLQQLTGMDLSGLSPEMQQKFAELSLKPKFENEAQLDLMKSLGMDMRNSDASSDESDKISPSRQKPRGLLKPELLEDRPETHQKRIKSEKSILIPQERINSMSLIKPALADKWQRANDNVIKQQIHSENFAQKEKENAEKAQRAIDRDKRDLFESDRDFNTKFSFPVIEEANQDSKNLAVKEAALGSMIDAIDRGDDVGFMSPDWWADFTGIKALRTMTGAQLENAAKEFLMSSVGQAGSRPNQWIEQRLLSMAPEIGKTKVANKTYAEGLKQELDLRKAYIREVQRLSQEDFNKYGYPKADIAIRASQNIEPYIKERQEIAKYRMQYLYEQEKNIKSVEDLKTVPRGTPLTIRTARILKNKFGANAAEAAKRLGYDFTDKEIIKKAQQQ